ncbi:MAG TPA: dihydrofolate reductase family protein [Actinomycetota bacterium]|nr:dihydrofolate reductase family protein [Actinomycetota bacterium]
MPRLIYSMTVSLDGFIAGPDGNIDWGAPDEELHRFHNERVRALGGHLLGRRLYETMQFWDTARDDPALAEYALEFAEIWVPLPKVVFSRTLNEVAGNTRLARRGIAEEVAELQERSGKDVGIGGAGLAAEAITLGLVDVFQLFVAPVVLGGGTPFFPSTHRRMDLELVETRTFGSRVVYLHYARA